MLRRCFGTLKIRGFMMAANAAVLQFFNAVRENEISKVTELLKSAAVDVNEKDETCDNQTALHIAASNGHNDLVKILVDDFKADVNASDDDGKIPLQLATDVYNMRVVKFLLQRDSQMRDYAAGYLNEKIIDELFDAAEANDIHKVIKLVKEQNVDVNSVDRSSDNRTMLHVAAAKGYKELVRVLVDELHANIQLEDDIGETAKNNAVDHNHPEIVEFFLQRGYVEREYGSLTNDSD